MPCAWRESAEGTSHQLTLEPTGHEVKQTESMVASTVAITQFIRF